MKCGNVNIINVFDYVMQSYCSVYCFFLFGVAISDLNVVIFAGQSASQDSTNFAGQPAGNRRVTGRVGSWKSRPVPSSVWIVTIFTKWPLSWMFSLLVNLDPVWVMLEGQGHRSKFKLTGGNCCLSGHCDLERRLSDFHVTVAQLRWVSTLNFCDLEIKVSSFENTWVQIIKFLVLRLGVKVLFLVSGQRSWLEVSRPRPTADWVAESWKIYSTHVLTYLITCRSSTGPCLHRCKPHFMFTTGTFSMA